MGTSVHEVIDALRTLPSNAERGSKFEQLMVRYFQLDPVLSQQYDGVWGWLDWPGRDGKVDTGIDLVARERDTGELTAIQCKFYEPTHTLAKADIDSFFTASGKKPFSNRIIISTTDHWSKHAEEALADQFTEVQRIGLAEIAESPIDWDIAWPSGQLEVELSLAEPHQLKPYQQTAVQAVLQGFAEGSDRGKLIMACGTGKTFTALKIAERIAADQGGAARVLFLVPSISLLSQTLREWTAQSELDIRAFGVCSDSKVSRAAEDVRAHDVQIPVTTDPARLAAEMAHRKRAAGLTVVFSTYQSLPTVAGAQHEHGVDGFDLVVCDEAHRTTGVTLAGAEESNFVRIHDPDYVKAARRLYMTATPRIFDDATKAQAEEHSAEITSMDNEADFGPEFYRLPFGAAVDAGLLTDYKVLVLTVDESVIAGPLQFQLAVDHSELQLDDASKIIGCWNGLAKRAGTTPDGSSFPPDAPPMQRAVAFARDIASSKRVAQLFPAVVDAYRDLLATTNDSDERDQAENGDGIEGADEVSDSTGTGGGAGPNAGLVCDVHHVDGTFNALERGRELAWLKAPIPDGECRILSNARCLSEGVDVPALDAVLFLHPRNSVVDVVQSVGRVMRRSPGKDYGYIILPVAVPAGIEPSQALADNKRFKVVWQVLNALRAHDDRFNAMVNSIRLNTSKADALSAGSDRLLGGHIGPLPTDTESIERDTSTGGDGAGGGDGAPGDAALTRQMALFSLAEWQQAIFARIVDKVGTRVYWEQWAADVADIAGRLVTRITAVLDKADPATREAFQHFHQGLKDNLNDSIAATDAVGMLAQHLITRPVFDALFAGHEFASHNPVSIAMQRMVDVLGQAGLNAETASLQGFYDSVRRRAAEVISAEGKQQLIAELYEKFFKIGFAKTADALGIVFTPTQVVDFILRAADQVMRAEFGRGLTDQGVHILDPFTGTGTFITRLLQSGLIRPSDLARKYASELHANEIMLLAYYIAAVNIETTYHALTGAPGTDGTENPARYRPFDGIVLADTFQITEADDTFDDVMFPQNNQRITQQLTTPMTVIVGNPPYSVGQGSANDLNANIKYPTLDGRIADTYGKRSTATNKNSLYDSYLRALRWATDRIGDTGVVAFVTNGGWIDGNTADGIRLSLADEYTGLWIYNLRGNQRTAGELSRKEGGKIFGSGSRNTIAIIVGVKNPKHTGPCQIHYRDIGDYLSRDDKLAILGESTLDRAAWTTIIPNAEGDWIEQRSEAFITWPTVGDKRPTAGTVMVFRELSRGLETARDAWVYNYSRTELEGNVRRLIDNYNGELRPLQNYCDRLGITNPDEKVVTQYLKDQPEAAAGDRIKWSRSLRTNLAKGRRITYHDQGVVSSAYRPFSRQWTYFDRYLNHERSQMPAMFPTPNHVNIGIILTAPASHFEFTPFITDLLPNLHTLDTAQFFPRWTYVKAEPNDGGFDFDSVAEDTTDGTVDEWGYSRVDNVTDAILAHYRETLSDSTITKDDIFYSVYGQLHDPDYRAAYAADLKKMLPHIPTPESLARFRQLADAGRALADLHVNYESVEPFPLDVRFKPGADPANRETWRIDKMRWGKKIDPDTGKRIDDPSTIVYNHLVTVTGIPADAHRYMLGPRSALAWILDRYQVRTDKASGIVNDPNDWCDEHDDPAYIVDLIKRVTAVSIETVRIVDEELR